LGVLQTSNRQMRGPGCASPTGSRDVERHLSGGGGVGSGVVGGTVPTIYGWAHLHTQQRFWNQTPGEGLDSPFSGVGQGVRRRAGVRILTSPWLSAAEFSPVNERVTSM